SLGVVHVFQVSLGGGGDKTFRADGIVSTQLPVPDTESTESWQDENRANIEAVHYVAATGRCLWAARGGAGYAGGDALCEEVWLRSAQFDPDSGRLDISSVEDKTIPNLGRT
ncbi:unnamed protein product, partial [marine sediment metagenome]